MVGKVGTASSDASVYLSEQYMSLPTVLFWKRENVRSSTTSGLELQGRSLPQLIHRVVFSRATL